MNEYWRQAERDLMRLWHALELKGYDPIRPQFDVLKEPGSGATLSYIRSKLRNYMEDRANFNPDGTLKNLADPFIQFLDVQLPRENETDAETSINFGVHYTPERRFHIPGLYLCKAYKKDVFTGIEVKLKPGFIPTMNGLIALMAKEDEKRIKNKQNVASPSLYLSRANMKQGRLRR